MYYDILVIEGVTVSNQVALVQQEKTRRVTFEYGYVH